MKKIVLFSVLSSLALGSVAFADADKGGKPHHGMFAKLDANADGKITREEASVSAKALFERLDGNRDGKLSDVELSAKHSEKVGKFQGRMDEKLWSKDTNRDGKLQRAEVSKLPDQWFGKLDANSDGVLTRDELSKAGEAMKARMAQHSKERFSKLDKNNDGVVDATELQTFATTMFDKFDADKNGSVERGELPKHGRGHFFGKRGGNHHDCEDGTSAPRASGTAG